MVMAALAFKEEDIQKLGWLGVKDSKQLSSEAREELFDRIRELVHDFRVEVIEPDAIDLSMEETTSNLNWLEADTSARMVSELDPDEAIIDCPSVNIANYQAYFAEKLDKKVRDKVKLIIEHKADVNHIVVSAASIIAKVIRDQQVDRLKEEIKIDFGSGYMSDPKTKNFLEQYYEKYPALFRHNWRPYKDLAEKKKQKSLGEF